MIRLLGTLFKPPTDYSVLDSEDPEEGRRTITAVADAATDKLRSAQRGHQLELPGFRDHALLLGKLNCLFYWACKNPEADWSLLRERYADLRKHILEVS